MLKYSLVNNEDDNDNYRWVTVQEMAMVATTLGVNMIKIVIIVIRNGKIKWW